MDVQLASHGMGIRWSSSTLRNVIIKSWRFLISIFIFLLAYMIVPSALAADCAVGPSKDLSNCDFSNQDLGTANLSGSRLTGANLAGANLSKANLSKVYSGGIQGIPVGLPLNWRIVMGYLIGPTANLTDANLHKANLDGSNLSYANISNADFSFSSLDQAKMIGINATSTNFSGALLYRTTLTDANFAGANLENANLAGSNVSSIDLSGSNLVGLKSRSPAILFTMQGEPQALPKDWFMLQGALIGPSADLSGAIFSSPDFRGRNLANVNFSFTKINSGKFDNADLQGANFFGARIGVAMVRVDSYGSFSYWVNGPCPSFRQSNLSRVNFDNSTIGAFDVTSLMRADSCGSSYPSNGTFSFAQLNDASFVNATVGKMDFSDTLFERVDFSGAKIDAIFSNVQASQIVGQPAILPSGFFVQDGYLLGPGVKLRSVNLDKVDLEGKNLRGVDFSFSNLSYKNLSLTNLSFANFTGANLVGSSLIGANLSSSIITGANLTDADFTSSNLLGIVSGSIKGEPFLLPDKWKTVNGYLLGPGANLDSADLSGANLSGLDLSGTSLRNANLANVISGGIQGKPSFLPSFWSLVNGYLMGPKANLTAANLKGLYLQVNISGAILTNADLSGTKIYNSDLSGVSSGGITGSPSGLQSGWSVVGGYLVGPEANLSGADLKGLDLRSSQLSSANLIGANLSAANLSRVRLDHADLSNSILANADLSYVDLTDANLSDADLSGAKVTGIRGGIRGTPLAIPSNWTLVKNYLIGPGADLSYAYLSDADLTSVVSGAITGIPGSLPANWKILKGYLVGPGANLTGADLSFQTLDSMDLSFANLSGAKLNGASLYGTNLASANLRNTVFDSGTLNRIRSGSITGVPLSLPHNWTLIGGYLIGPSANLYGADLGGLDLSGTSLNRVQSGSITGTPLALPDKWKLLSGFLVGPEAVFSNVDLTGIDFDGADLTGASFSGANISKAVFETTILKGVYSEFLTGDPSSLPLGWSIFRGALVGPGAYLRGKDFTGADFSNRDLSGADLNGVNLSGAKLSNTSMSGSNLSYANFTSASLSGTDLSGSDLTGANFSNAQISKIKAISLTGAPVNLPPYFQVRNGQLARVPKLMPSPVVSGFYNTGQTLTVETGTWDEDCTKMIKWLRDDVEINVATNETYTLTSNDFGHLVGAEVSCTAPGYFQSPVKSLSRLVQTGTFILSPPSIKGSAKTGQVLSALTDSWGLQPLRSYQWIRDGVPISGANNLTYKLSQQDYGKFISVEVGAVQTGFSTSFLSSRPVKVGLGEMTPFSSPITGLAKVGSVLRTYSQPWVSGAKIRYQWLAGGKAIKGATLSSYKVGSAQKGKKISVQITQEARGYATRFLITSDVLIR